MDMDTTAVADITNVGATTINRTTAVTNRFFRPAAPAALLDMDANGDQEDTRDEIEIRQSHYNSLKQSKAEAMNRVRQSEKAYQSFKLLSDQYMEADKVRVPDADQTAIINELQTTVSTIVLTGDAAAGSVREQTRNRMVKRLSELKTRHEADRKQWDNFCSEFNTCAAALKSARDRNGGNSQPIVDGRLMFCPFRGGSMARCSRDIIIEIWSAICGPQMLNLNFNKLLLSVRELRKSLQNEIRVNKPGKV